MLLSIMILAMIKSQIFRGYYQARYSSDRKRFLKQSSKHSGNIRVTITHACRNLNCIHVCSSGFVCLSLIKRHNQVTFSSLRKSKLFSLPEGVHKTIRIQFPSGK